MLNASEMGIKAWESRKKKYTPKQLKEMQSKNGKLGGRPRKLPIDKS